MLRFFPSLTDVAFLTPAIFLFSKLEGAKSLLGDGDTGWHVRTGEWILQNGRVPDKDIFSFTKPGEVWYAWEWLWDLGAAYLHQRGGMAAVVIACGNACGSCGPTRGLLRQATLNGCTQAGCFLPSMVLGV